jgi:hypothetical protein
MQRVTVQRSEVFQCSAVQCDRVDVPGGDDVQQLCEAGEEEFLEIMALVRIACTALHCTALHCTVLH